MDLMRRRRIALALAISLLMFGAGAAEMQEAEFDEAKCILRFWPYAPPETLDDVLDLLRDIENECSPSMTLFAHGSNIREEPSTLSPIVGKLLFRQEVQAVCGIEGEEWNGNTEWCSLEGENVPAGYVHAGLLSETEPPPPVAGPVTRNCDEGGWIWRAEGGCHHTDLPSGPGICTYSQAYGHYAWQRPEPPGHEWKIRHGQIVGDERWGWIVVKDHNCRPA